MLKKKKSSFSSESDKLFPSLVPSSPLKTIKKRVGNPHLSLVKLGEWDKEKKGDE